MNPGRAVADALDTLAAERTSFLTLRETVNELGGNRKAADAFGVHIRTVERWLKIGGGQKRQLSGSSTAIRKRVAEVQRGLAAEKMKEDLGRGFAVDSMHFELTFDGNPKYARWREKDDLEIEEPDEDDVDELVNAWIAGDESGMARAFDSLYLEAWGHGTLALASTTAIDGLSLVITH